MKLDEYLNQQTIAITDPSLLEMALTHRSYVHERWEVQLHSNERLEFLGDSILNFLTARFLYDAFSDKEEGELTTMRAALVRTSTLARFARELEIGSMLKLGRGEIQSGGREREPLLADAFEAVLAAIFLDNGEDAAELFLQPLLQSELSRISQNGLVLDEKSRLQERMQGERNLTPRYETVRVEGPDHERRFTIEVWAGSTRLGVGEGFSKQAAAQVAARVALAALDQGLIAEDYQDND